VHSVMYTKDPQTGEPKAASVGIILLDIARALGGRIGAEILLLGHPTIPEMLTCLTTGACDMGFMGPDPSRTGVDFSPPILQLDYTLQTSSYRLLHPCLIPKIVQEDRLITGEHDLQKGTRAYRHETVGSRICRWPVSNLATVALGAGTPQQGTRAISSLQSASQSPLLYCHNRLSLSRHCQKQ